ncbi:tubby C-terminal-like domain-containing protein [Coemansia spiralis]|nr:tubby C-terminal-like domain-containing protein [Coemansia spiralis]
MTDESGSIIVLENKLPKWNTNSRSYTLDFHGRVTVSSSKNFQLINLDDDEYVVVQFGKVGDDTYSLDFRFPMSPVMAFGIVLTSLVRKLACA